jgi:hypothetical protein
MNILSMKQELWRLLYGNWNDDLYPVLVGLAVRCHNACPCAALACPSVSSKLWLIFFLRITSKFPNYLCKYICDTLYVFSSSWDMTIMTTTMNLIEIRSETCINRKIVILFHRFWIFKTSATFSFLTLPYLTKWRLKLHVCTVYLNLAIFLTSFKTSKRCVFFIVSLVCRK